MNYLKAGMRKEKSFKKEFGILIYKYWFKNFIMDIKPQHLSQIWRRELYLKSFSVLATKVYSKTFDMVFQKPNKIIINKSYFHKLFKIYSIIFHITKSLKVWYVTTRLTNHNMSLKFSIKLFFWPGFKLNLPLKLIFVNVKIYVDKLLTVSLFFVYFWINWFKIL